MGLPKVIIPATIGGFWSDVFSSDAINCFVVCLVWTVVLYFDALYKYRNYIDDGFEDLLVGEDVRHSEAFQEDGIFATEVGVQEQQQQGWEGNHAELDHDSTSAEDPLAMFGGTTCKTSVSDGKRDDWESTGDMEKMEQRDNVSSLVQEGKRVQKNNHEDMVLEKESDGHDATSCLPVFEYLDRKDRENVPSGTNGEERHGHHTGEAVAEFGHKAARAIQMGTKWFFHASKQIAKDVQSRIDARSGREKKHSRQSSIIDSPKSDKQQEDYHQLWAIQLSNASPETRAAALGAMDEMDRMSVQRILDDQIWIERPQTQPAVSGPPPSYEEVVVQDSFEKANIVEENKEKNSAVEKELEDSFDLLNLDGKDHGGGAQDSREWESGLFGNDGYNRDVESQDGDMELIFESKNSTGSGAPTKSQSQSAAAFAVGGDEPEIRRILREKRQAQERERIARQVATARDREAKEIAEKEGKVAIREKLRPEMDAWSAGKKDNIRSLLCTMETVLWEGSGWSAPTIADVMEPARVKRWYMKANLVVHPDKVKQKEGTLEQLVRAEMIFDVLKTAWGIFQTKEL